MSNELMNRRDLAGQGVKGVGGIAGGAGLLILASLGGSVVAPLVVGGLVTLGGLGLTRSKKDRTTGVVIAGAGALTLISAIPVLAGLSGVILGLGGVGLIAGGTVSLVKFFKNLKKRS